MICGGAADSVAPRQVQSRILQQRLLTAGTKIDRNRVLLRALHPEATSFFTVRSKCTIT